MGEADMHLRFITEDAVTIEGKTYPLHVTRYSTTRWRAYGSFGRKHLSGVGESYLAALEDWERKALSKHGSPGSGSFE
jgi:hypothetical protein